MTYSDLFLWHFAIETVQRFQLLEIAQVIIRSLKTSQVITFLPELVCFKDCWLIYVDMTFCIWLLCRAVKSISVKFTVPSMHLTLEGDSCKVDTLSFMIRAHCIHCYSLWCLTDLTMSADSVSGETCQVTPLSVRMLCCFGWWKVAGIHISFSRSNFCMCMNTYRE